MKPERDPSATPTAGTEHDVISDSSPVDDDDTRAARVRMVDGLLEAGKVTDPQVAEALYAVPRHLFVPRFLADLNVHGTELDGHDPDTRQQWLGRVYSDTTLLIERSDGQPRTSSTMPHLLAVMIESLDLTGAERVLEIGTGTGYNTALLTLLVGERNVHSVDIEPDLIEAADRRLAAFALRPSLYVGDGAQGWRAHGPYDRILATCAVPHIPPAWLDQLSERGRIVAPIRRGLAVLDHPERTPGDSTTPTTNPETTAHTVRTRLRAIGRFHPQPAYFMALRPGDLQPTPGNPPGPEPAPGPEPTSDPPAPRRTVRHGALDTVHHRDVRFLLDLALPDLQVGQHAPQLTDVTVTDAHHSSASLHTLNEQPSTVTVEQTGPRALWDEIETLTDWWHAHHCPPRDRFGITITDHDQRAWLDHPDNTSWSLTPPGPDPRR